MTTQNDKNIWKKYLEWKEGQQSRNREFAIKAAQTAMKTPVLGTVIKDVGKVLDIPHQAFIRSFGEGIGARVDIAEDPKMRASGVPWYRSGYINPIGAGAQGVIQQYLPKMSPKMTKGWYGGDKGKILQAEQIKREKELGRTMSGLEVREMEHEVYKAPKYVRGAFEEAPWLAVPGAGALRKAANIGRAGLVAPKIIKTSQIPGGVWKHSTPIVKPPKPIKAKIPFTQRSVDITPAVRTGLEAAEGALKPIERFETAAGKAITAPFKDIARPLGIRPASVLGPEILESRAMQPIRAATSAVARTMREPGRAGPARTVAGTYKPRADVGQVYPQRTQMPTEIYGSEHTMGGVTGEGTPQRMTGLQIRNEAKEIFDRTEGLGLERLNVDDAFESSWSKNHGIEAEKMFREEYNILQSPKVADFTRAAMRDIRRTFDTLSDRVSELGPTVVDKVYAAGLIRRKVNAAVKDVMGAKVPTSRDKEIGYYVKKTEEVMEETWGKLKRRGDEMGETLNRLEPRYPKAVKSIKRVGETVRKVPPFWKADGYMRLMNALQDDTFALRNVLDTKINDINRKIEVMTQMRGVHPDSALVGDLEKRAGAYLTFPERVTKVLGYTGRRAFNRLLNFFKSEGGYNDILYGRTKSMKTPEFEEVFDVPPEVIIDHAHNFIQANNWKAHNRKNAVSYSFVRESELARQNKNVTFADTIEKTSGEPGVDNAYELVDEGLINEWANIDSNHYTQMKVLQFSDGREVRRKFSQQEIDKIKAIAIRTADLSREVRDRLFKAKLITERLYRILSQDKYRFYNPMYYAEKLDSGELSEVVKKMVDNKGISSNMNVTESGIHALSKSDITFSSLPPTSVDVLGDVLLKAEYRINKNRITSELFDTDIANEFGLIDVSGRFREYEVRLQPLGSQRFTTRVNYEVRGRGGRRTDSREFTGKTLEESRKKAEDFYTKRQSMYGPRGARILDTKDVGKFTPAESIRVTADELPDVLEKHPRFLTTLPEPQAGMMSAEERAVRNNTKWGMPGAHKNRLVDMRYGFSEVRLKKILPDSPSKSPIAEELQNYDATKKSGLISFFTGDGERRVLAGPDGGVVPKDVWDLIHGRNGLPLNAQAEYHWTLKAASGMNDYFRSIYTTHNPLFAIRNGVIDMHTAQLQAGVGAHKSAMRMAKNIETMFLNENAEDRIAELWDISGGMADRYYSAKRIDNEIAEQIRGVGHTGAIVADSSKQLKRALDEGTWNYWEKLKRFVPRLGSAIEQGPRQAVFEAALVERLGQKEVDWLKRMSKEEWKRMLETEYVPKYDKQGNLINNRTTTGVPVDQVPEFQQSAVNGIQATLDFDRGGSFVKNMNRYFLFLKVTQEAVKAPFRTLGFNLHPEIKRIDYTGRQRNPGDPTWEWGELSDLPSTVPALGARVGKSLLKPLGGRGPTGAVQPFGGSTAAAIRLAQMVSAYYIIQNLWNKSFLYNGVPLYYDIPSFIRNNSLIFMFPSERDGAGNLVMDPRTGRPKLNYITVPHRLREWNLFFQTANYIDEQTDERVAIDKKKFWKEVLASFHPTGGDTSDMFTPEALSVGLEVFTGRDAFRDRDIVSEEYQQLPPDQQYNRYTSKTARKAAGLLERVDESGIPGIERLDEVLGSPQRLEHLFESVAGGLGRVGLSVGDTIINGLTAIRSRFIESDESPMKQKIDEYLNHMDATERKMFLVSLSEKQYEEFQRQLKEPQSETPFFGLLKKSYYPERGGGIKEIGRTETEKVFPDIDPKQSRMAGIQASKDRQRLKFKQDKDDASLNRWRSNDRGKKMSPKEWRESHSTKWKLYEHDLSRLGYEFPASIYAQTDDVRDKYYIALNTAAGQMTDLRNAADLLIAGYYAIKPASEDPSSTEWSSYFDTRNEYIANVRASSEGAGNNVYNEFMARLTANNTATENSYHEAMKSVSPYWNAGRNIQEMYSQTSVPQGFSLESLQELWNRYLNSNGLQKRNLINENKVIKDVLDKRKELRRKVIVADTQRNRTPVMEMTLVFWFGGDYYRNPITTEGKAYHQKLYARN